MKTCETCRHYKPAKYMALWCRLYRQFLATSKPCVDHKEAKQ